MSNSEQNVIFSTAKLSVRELRQADFLAFHEMQSDNAVMKYTTTDGCGLNVDVNRSQFASCMAAYTKPDNQFWVWAIENLEQEFVGTCAIIENDARETEIGYRFLRQYWGRGFGKEIANPLIEYAVNQLNKQSIVAYVDVRNVASVKILEASLLEFVGEKRTGEILDREYRLKIS